MSHRHEAVCCSSGDAAYLVSEYLRLEGYNNTLRCFKQEAQAALKTVAPPQAGQVRTLRSILSEHIRFQTQSLDESRRLAQKRQIERTKSLLRELTTQVNTLLDEPHGDVAQDQDSADHTALDVGHGLPTLQVRAPRTPHTPGRGRKRTEPSRRAPQTQHSHTDGLLTALSEIRRSVSPHLDRHNAYNNMHATRERQHNMHDSHAGQDYAGSIAAAAPSRARSNLNFELEFDRGTTNDGLDMFLGGFPDEDGEAAQGTLAMASLIASNINEFRNNARNIPGGTSSWLAPSMMADRLLENESLLGIIEPPAFCGDGSVVDRHVTQRERLRTQWSQSPPLDPDARQVPPKSSTHRRSHSESARPLRTSTSPGAVGGSNSKRRRVQPIAVRPQTRSPPFADTDTAPPSCAVDTRGTEPNDACAAHALSRSRTTTSPTTRATATHFRPTESQHGRHAAAAISMQTAAPLGRAESQTATAVGTAEDASPMPRNTAESSRAPLASDIRARDAPSTRKRKPTAGASVGATSSDGNQIPMVVDVTRVIKGPSSDIALRTPGASVLAATHARQSAETSASPSPEASSHHTSIAVPTKRQCPDGDQSRAVQQPSTSTAVEGLLSNTDADMVGTTPTNASLLAASTGQARKPVSADAGVPTDAPRAKNNADSHVDPEACASSSAQTAPTAAHQQSTAASARPSGTTTATSQAKQRRRSFAHITVMKKMPPRSLASSPAEHRASMSPETVGAPSPLAGPRVASGDSLARRIPSGAPCAAVVSRVASESSGTVHTRAAGDKHVDIATSKASVSDTATANAAATSNSTQAPSTSVSTPSAETHRGSGTSTHVVSSAEDIHETNAGYEMLDIASSDDESSHSCMSRPPATHSALASAPAPVGHATPAAPTPVHASSSDTSRNQSVDPVGAVGLEDPGSKCAVVVCGGVAATAPPAARSTKDTGAQMLTQMASAPARAQSSGCDKEKRIEQLLAAEYGDSSRSSSSEEERVPGV
eukprot:m.789103 g.789103  ORF g.789103 m.789103 type:complete len:998 (+) comp23322_c0_seq7:392-3385(+)